MTSEVRPDLAIPAARLIAVVVLPTPPFWLATQMILATVGKPPVLHSARGNRQWDSRHSIARTCRGFRPPRVGGRGSARAGQPDGELRDRSFAGDRIPEVGGCKAQVRKASAGSLCSQFIPSRLASFSSSSL